MRIFWSSTIRAGERACASRDSESGFAVLVVLILLAIMASLAIGNNVALGHLQRELRLIEQRQQQRYDSLKANRAAVALSLKPVPGVTGDSTPSQRPEAE